MGGRRTKIIAGATEEKPATAPTKTAKEEKEKAKAPSAAKKTVPKRARPGRGKKYLAVKGKVEAGRSYPVSEAVRLAKETAFTKFDGSVEAHINLGLDPSKQEQKIRATVALPHGTGKKVRVLVFAEGKEAKAAADAGADAVGDEQMLAKIAAEGKVDFDVVVATPSFMPKLAKVARILGPKGLMPSPKAGTINEEPAKLVAEIKKGRVELKTEAQPIIHVVLGKVSFPDKDLEENLRAVLDSLNRAKPSGVRGDYIKSVYLKSTMGPSVRVAGGS